MRFAATLYEDQLPSRLLGEEDAVDLLRSRSVDAKQIRKTANWLIDVTRACDTVTKNPRINAVTRISQARLLAVAISLRSDIKPNQKDVLLARWEKVTFRIYGMLGKDSRTRVGEYVRLAWQVKNDGLKVHEISSAIGSIGEDFPIDQATDCLRATNCYDGWQEEIRYFMFRYEEYLAEKQGMNYRNEQWQKIWMVNASNSIEHILAKSKANESQRHRLGNLVLLPPKLNSKLQANAPKDKADAYRKTGLLIAGEVADLIDEKGWTSKVINDRENALIEWATEEWAD